MMNRGLFAILIGSFILFSSPSVSAMEANFWGLLSLPEGSTRGDPVLQTSLGKAAYGGGVSLNYTISKKWGFETGLFYSPRGFKYHDELVGDGSLNFRWLILPAMIRLISSRNLSVGFGGFYARSLDTKPNLEPLGVLSINDLGLIASLNVKFPILSWLAIVGDIRYLYGMTDLSQVSSATVYLQDVQFLLGISIKN
jgi:hypothetical protein